MKRYLIWAILLAFVLSIPVWGVSPAGTMEKSKPAASTHKVPMPSQAAGLTPEKTPAKTATMRPPKKPAQVASKHPAMKKQYAKKMHRRHVKTAVRHHKRVAHRSAKRTLTMKQRRAIARLHARRMAKCTAFMTSDRQMTRQSARQLCAALLRHQRQMALANRQAKKTVAQKSRTMAKKGTGIS